MQSLLQLFILLPIAGFFSLLFIPRKKESIISSLAIGVVGLHLAGVFAFLVMWMINLHPVLDIKHIVLYKTTGFEIFIDFYFDRITAVFALVGAILTFLVTIFSRFYLHRELGFKRFFITLLVFYTGYNLVIFSGNFETLFIGWEFLGISSFLLIAFYRDRYLPVKNGLKVISLYRFSDVCLMLAMWLSHHLWHENITFNKLGNLALVNQQISAHYPLALAIAIFIVIAAAVKSAQLPFSSWLPRAMEGPTTSSAIFYGSLSVHIGVFLLLRTYSFWEGMAVIKFAVIAIGVMTILVANSIANVQSSVKTQIAYSSIVQIGIIFIEVALGFHVLALFHFAGNAFLRTYQLLVSPSVLSYLIHNQFYHFKPGSVDEHPSLLQKIKHSVYILSVKEYNLDTVLYRVLWNPFKLSGRGLGFLKSNIAVIVLIAIYLAGLFCFVNRGLLPASVAGSLPVIFSAISLLLVLSSFGERGDARNSWIMICCSQFFLLLSVLLNEPLSITEIFIYLGGTSLAAITGLICLNKIKKIDQDIELNGFHGYTYEEPVTGVIFLLSCLALLGFPITPTFIGIDVMFTHISAHQFPLVVFTSLSLLFIEITVLRIYARIFMGQHKKTFHPIAYRSS
jgi:NADH:ubiquinone oxidoreductase subunit 5 (subunit L)/multisubunit Na+/H+ antiporter MnhA subunit